MIGITMDKRTDLIEFETMLLGRHVHMNARGRRSGDLLERSAYILLSRLEAQGSMTLAELSEAFGLDVSTLNRQTAAMARENLVERISDQGGGIARRFRATTHGAQLLDRARTEIVSGLDQVMHDWSAEDIVRFAGYLQRFNTDIERLAGRPWPRVSVADEAVGDQEIARH
jgi:DNA-binding MarR family transcriptional regulator